ncbi:MAG: response regulator, partial [Propionibacteriaceae bacterium]|nr:response regulator [Propionibacteriaceae bacterium]
MAAPATVLVVDDEENINYLVASALQLAGLRTLRAATGAAALDLALGESPDAIVLDVMLPDLDGFEVLRRLRERRVTIPVIILTARDSVQDTVAGLEGGADDYMPKPFRFEEL